MRFETRLGLDYGSSNTVAALQTPQRPTRILLFDGSPHLPSAVSAAPGQHPSGQDAPAQGSSSPELLTGKDALHYSVVDPSRVELHPKRWVSDPTLLLGEAEYRVSDLVAATLRRVRHEAERVAGHEVDALVMTCPVAWGPRRRGVLAAAAGSVGLPPPRFVPEPVAAAAYYATQFTERIPVGGSLVVYDFGAGTFDASVVRRGATGFDVRATEGLADLGGLDVDAALVEHLLTGLAQGHPHEVERLRNPRGPEDRRARQILWQGAREAKEMLSRAASTFVHIPLVGIDLPLGREEFERLAAPLLEQTVAAVTRVMVDSGVVPAELTGVFLVGGSSRIPLAATLLHRAVGTPPTALDQPELVVAQGALMSVVTAAGLAPTVPLAALGTRIPPSAAAPFTPFSPAPPAARVPGPAVFRPRTLRVRQPRIRWIALLIVLLVLAGAITAWWPEVRGAVTGLWPRVGPSATGSGDPRFPQDLVGSWSGTLAQSDGPTWSVTVVFAAERRRAAVAYTQLGCRGIWKLDAVEDDGYRVTETITEGVEHCSDQGVLVIRRKGADTLTLAYRPLGAAYTADGLLTRS